LDGGQGGLPAGTVGDLDVDLGAVERGLSLGCLVGQAGVVENVGQQGGGPLPLLGTATYLTSWPGREPVTGRGEAERLTPGGHFQRRLRLQKEHVTEFGVSGIRTDMARTLCVVPTEGDHADRHSVEIDHEKAEAPPRVSVAPAMLARNKSPKKAAT
jgi:hypothetical protein